MKLSRIRRLFFRTPVWIIQMIEMSIYFIISKFYRNSDEYKDIWLISDTGDSANDNGYHFFKYLNENHKEINSIFVISSKNRFQYNRVNNIGKTIPFMGFKHKLYFMLSKFIISPHIWYLQPWSYKLFKRFFDKKDRMKAVFLQHGIIMSDLSDNLNLTDTMFNLFVTSTEREHKSIANTPNYGYYNNEVILTGLPRYDNLLDFTTKKQILFMPTWRNSFRTIGFMRDIWASEKQFKKSSYYKHIHKLLNSEELNNILEINNLNFIFYPHYKSQRYLYLFSSKFDRVKIVSVSNSDVQTLLKESQLLITDYSSIYFDFAYMKKPITYYQFDAYHYKKGYFDFEIDGFGNIVSEHKFLIEEIQHYINNSFAMEKLHKKRVDNFYKFRDTDNCKRVYNEIISRF